MMRWNRWELRATIVLALAAIVILSTKVQTQLTTLPTAAPGVTQTAVVNTPTVRAEQAGTWRIELTPEILQRLDGLNAASPTAPSFLESQKRYAFTWDLERPAVIYTIVQVRRDGWVSATTEGERGAPRQVSWLNAARAVMIQEVR